jgi:hypothetical protein
VMGAYSRQRYLPPSAGSFGVPAEGLGQEPGKHARYDPTVLYLAALLNTFAERGLQVSQQRKLVEAYEMFEPPNNWTIAKRKERDLKLFLVISRRSCGLVRSVISFRLSASRRPYHPRDHRKGLPRNPRD